jgi:hypothetical protein
MAKKQHFIPQKLINTIIQRYGGGHRWEKDKAQSRNDLIWFSEKGGCSLTINQMWEGKNGQFPYIEVHISDFDGNIYRKDRYDYTDTSQTNVEFAYVDENGVIYDYFIDVGDSISRNKKVKNIKDLEKKLQSAQDRLEWMSARNSEMVNNAEKEFLHSPTYNKMLQEIEYLKALKCLCENHIYDIKKTMKSSNDTVRQIYNDNKAFYEHRTDDEYFIGITENWHAANEYIKLQNELRRLESVIEGQEQIIADRDNEISRLQEVISGDDAKSMLSASQNRVSQLESELSLLRQQTANSDSNAIIEQNIEQLKTKRKPGRPAKIGDDKTSTVLELKKNGNSIRSIAKNVGISVGAVHRIIKMNKDNE